MGPAAVVTGMTLTGDVITGPGVPTVLTTSMIQSVVGDLVSGAACEGAITMGSTTVLVSGRPAATVTSQVTGVNPETGAPVTTAVAPPGATTVIIGS